MGYMPGMNSPRPVLGVICCNRDVEGQSAQAVMTRYLNSALKFADAAGLLVPAMPALYGTLDVALNHYRRYDKSALVKLVTDSGFEVRDVRYLNRLGVAGWWLNSRVLKRTVLPKGQLAMFRWLMPLLKREEQNPPSFGMSLLVLATRR